MRSWTDSKVVFTGQKNNIFMDKVIGRCMRCKENKEMKDIEEVVMKNGMKAAKGKCVDCDCNMYKILGKA